jgi:protocatechuate 3,4-dioxygenase beta subunit
VSLTIRATAVALVLSGSSGTAAREPVLGGPCEDCHVVYEGMPDQIESRSRITPKDEPGLPLVIDGTVRDMRGKPVPGIIVYVHHTNAQGIYPRAETRHGRIRGWAKSDSSGAYRFETVRPGAYPNADIPQHIHFHIIEPGRGLYWIGDINFDDDPLVTEEFRKRLSPGRGGYGLCTPTKDANGVWHVRRDIELGSGVPGYPPPVDDSAAEPDR